MSVDDRVAVRTPAPKSRVRDAVDNGLRRPRKSADSKLLLYLARKLHDNETAFGLMRNAFRLLQRIGISVSPNHYYWPVPDFRKLELRKWPEEEKEPIGLNLRFDRQLDFLQNVVSRYRAEWQFHSAPMFGAGYEYNNGFFEAVDAEIAYCMIRHYKPRRIVEVGGGYSSRVLAAALDRNLKSDGVCGNLVTIEPYPERFPKNTLFNNVQVIAETVQNVCAGVFLGLQRGDFLFLDSSHVVGVGSDVVREYLEIIPRLAGGVLIHAHDIFIPGDYPRESVLRNLAFWSEQYLLQAFLMFNQQFEVLWGSSYMQSRAHRELDDAFPHWKCSYRNMTGGKRRFLPTRDGNRVWPSSFWIRKLA
ncbi:MAG TPA: class I SAM-dependent methyltransferase [Candidatus Sulfotelmatobacter sp.]|jgi:predicted O-methyltransferase YrrM|nr:class I SAM-dependent methyltransferase [Candidatus Sulfotelmatobacter sp.]